MKSLFFFGKNGIEVEMREGFACHEVRSRKTVAVDDEIAAVNQALDDPIACRPLVDLARGKKTAAISVCDITRPAPNPITLPPLLARLETAGIARENIRILIATGLHRAATPAEIDRIVGPEIAAMYTVLNHTTRVTSPRIDPWAIRGTALRCMWTNGSSAQICTSRWGSSNST